MIPSGQVSAATQAGGEKQTKPVSETAKRAAMRPEGGYVDLKLDLKFDTRGRQAFGFRVHINLKSEIPVSIGKVRKNELPELRRRLRQLFFGNHDKLFRLMWCKSCWEVSFLPWAVQTNRVRPRKAEIVG